MVQYMGSSVRRKLPGTVKNLGLYPRDRLRRLQARSFLMLIVALSASACASVPLKEAGTLTTYSNLGETNGNFAKRRSYVEGRRMAEVTRVNVVPTEFSAAATSKIKSDEDRAVVSNALDRTLCLALSERYQLVPLGDHADLTVRAVVADIVTTDKTIAGVATAVSLGSAFVLPIGAPRLPIGLGGLAVEAEAVAADGDQLAAMVWSRGANSLSNARASEVGDAYALATTFADDFSQMLITGQQPREISISLPSLYRIQAWLGSNSKYAACDRFGKSPGITGLVASRLGLPPQWTDGGTRRQEDESTR